MVLAKLAANGKAWHLHPMGMVNFAIKEEPLITIEMLLAAHP